MLDGEAAHRAQEPEARLLDAREGPDRQAEVLADAPDERRPVRRVPERRGAGHDDALHPRAAGDRPEVPERFERPLQGLGRDPPRPVDVAHEPQGRAAAGEHVQVPSRLLTVDHHAPRVRADVDDGHGRRAAVRPRGVRHAEELHRREASRDPGWSCRRTPRDRSGGRPSGWNHLAKYRSSRKTLRFRMSPKMCCWIFSLARLVPLRLTITLPSASFTPSVAFSIV